MQAKQRKFLNYCKKLQLFISSIIFDITVVLFAINVTLEIIRIVTKFTECAPQLKVVLLKCVQMRRLGQVAVEQNCTLLWCVGTVRR